MSAPDLAYRRENHKKSRVPPHRRSAEDLPPAVLAALILRREEARARDAPRRYDPQSSAATVGAWGLCVMVAVGIVSVGYILMMSGLALSALGFRGFYTQTRHDWME